MFPHGFKSRHMAFVSDSFFVHFLFLFSSTVFRMHPYFGTVNALELSILVFSQVLFRRASTWLTHSRLSDYPIRVLVHLFIDFFLLFFLLQITTGNRKSCF